MGDSKFRFPSAVVQALVRDHLSNHSSPVNAAHSLATGMAFACLFVVVSFFSHVIVPHIVLLCMICGADIFPQLMESPGAKGPVKSHPTLTRVRATA